MTDKLSAGRPVVAQVLTPAQARECRRLARRDTERDRQVALRILRRACRRLDRGVGVSGAIETVMRGFSAIILSRLRERLNGR